MIDGDGRDDVDRFADSNIFALPVYAVESLYYCDDAISSVAREHAKLILGNADEMITNAIRTSLEELSQHGERLAKHICDRQLQMRWETGKLTPHDIEEGSDGYIHTRVSPSNLEHELNHYNQLVEEGELGEVVARYPVKDTGVADRIAGSLHFKKGKVGVGHYHKAVVKQAREDPNLAESLKRRLQPLVDAMAKKPTNEGSSDANPQ